MKQLFFLLLLVLGSTAAHSQATNLTILNYTDCMITMSVRSHAGDAGCATVQSDAYDFPPGGVAFLGGGSTSPFTYPSGPPPGTQIWDAVKFGYNSGGCFGGEDIGNPECGFDATWSSEGFCDCEGNTVHASWSVSGAYATVIFHY